MKIKQIVIIPIVGLLEILRSKRFTSAKQTIESLSTEVEAHRQGAEPNDDLTMMCLQIS